jgi:hypothetical protein
VTQVTQKNRPLLLSRRLRRRVTQVTQRDPHILSSGSPISMSRMMSLDSEQRYVILKKGTKGGWAGPVAPLQLIFDLEARGFTLRQDGYDLLVEPRSRLTPDDCQALRRWKEHILDLLGYEAPEL